MIKKIIGEPHLKNERLKKIITETKINYFYIKNHKDFKDRIIKDISEDDEVLDIGKAMRDKFKLIKCKKIETLDVNDFGDYPDIVLDICSEDTELLKNKYDKIICMSILEHVYNPFDAVKNLMNMLKPNGVIFGYVPYLYHYHAPNDLQFQDYFRFSKDALAYLFREFKEVELFPVRGRISSSLNYMFPARWKKYMEKTRINILLDKFFSDAENTKKCSGFNFIVKK